jgi:hypothetical protein
VIDDDDSPSAKLSTSQMPLVARIQRVEICHLWDLTPLYAANVSLILHFLADGLF